MRSEKHTSSISYFNHISIFLIPLEFILNLACHIFKKSTVCGVISGRDASGRGCSEDALTSLPELHQLCVTRNLMPPHDLLP